MQLTGTPAAEICLPATTECLPGALKAGKQPARRLFAR
jgi:hypothetical protein